MSSIIESLVDEAGGKDSCWVLPCKNKSYGYYTLDEVVVIKPNIETEDGLLDYSFWDNVEGKEWLGNITQTRACSHVEWDLQSRPEFNDEPSISEGQYFYCFDSTMDIEFIVDVNTDKVINLNAKAKTWEDTSEFLKSLLADGMWADCMSCSFRGKYDQFYDRGGEWVCKDCI